MGRTASVFFIAATAFGAGAVAGLLFAPASGTESRKKITGQVKAQTANLERQLREVEKNLTDLEEQVRVSGQELGSRVRTAANNAMDRLLPDVPEDESWSMEKSDLTSDLPHIPKL